MAKQQYWLVGGEADTFALVTGAEERDSWTRGGDWAVASEPGPDDWVYIWHADAAAPGRYPRSSLDALWSHRGWVAGPPPEGVHPFAPDAPAAPAEADSPAEPVADPKSSKPAAGGEPKEK